MHASRCLTLCTIGLGLLAGCRDNTDTYKYRELEGTVSSIDPASGLVEMSYFSTKAKKDITLTGKLAPDAEILINGATARLEDVQIGDHVVVTGREERHGGEKQMVATRVEVTRPTTATASAPAASRPARGRATPSGS